MGSRILVVDDEKNIVDIIKYNLKKEGYEVMTAGDGEEALRLNEEFKPDIILLDIMMPKLDGYAVCRKVREKYDTPIIMLTARAEEVDKVLGLELGADDYVTKPFGTRELMARVKANLRRRNISEEASYESTDKDVLSFGKLTIDLKSGKGKTRRLQLRYPAEYPPVRRFDPQTHAHVCKRRKEREKEREETGKEIRKKGGEKSVQEKLRRDRTHFLPYRNNRVLTEKYPSERMVLINLCSEKKNVSPCCLPAVREADFMLSRNPRRNRQSLSAQSTVSSIFRLPIVFIPVLIPSAFSPSISRLC